MGDEVDPVSAPDDGIESYDNEDADAVEVQLPSDSFDDSVADFESEGGE